MPKLPSRRVGVFGGSFNPVHVGHLLLARQALEALRLDEVLLIPCAASADGKALAPARLRLAWLRKSVRGESGLRVSDLEIRRGGVSRTVDTLRALRARLGAGTELTLLLGQDQWERFRTWKDWQAIPKLARLAVWPRGETRPRRGRGPRAQWMEPSPIKISSNEIRRRIRASLPLTWLLPPEICRNQGLKSLFKKL